LKLFKYQPVGPKDKEYEEYQKINYIEGLLSELAKERENVLDEKVEAYSQTFIRLLQWLKLAIEVRRENVIKRILHQTKLKELRAKAIEQEEERKKDREAFFEEEKAKWEEEMEKKKEAEEERKRRELEDQNQDEEEDEFADYDDDGKRNVCYTNIEQENKKEGEGEEEKEKSKHEGEGHDEEGEGEEDRFDEQEVYERFDEEKPPIEIPLEVIDDIDNDIDILPEELEQKEED
jgi:hypothetical protein